MRNIGVRFIVLVAIGVLISTLVPARAVQAQGVFTHGTVVALQATPHLWIADQQGILHWAGDTRALAGKHVRWDSRIEVTLAQLQELRRQDLFAALALLRRDKVIPAVSQAVLAGLAGGSGGGTCSPPPVEFPL